MSTILEIVNYTATAEAEKLMPINKRLLEFLQQQPGFIRRELSQNTETNSWTDLVWWQSLEEAHAAADKVMKESYIPELMAMVDDTTLVMDHKVLVSLD